MYQSFTLVQIKESQCKMLIKEIKKFLHNKLKQRCYLNNMKKNKLKSTNNKEQNNNNKNKRNKCNTGQVSKV